jgi:uncharacterized protein with HEPN domain
LKKHALRIHDYLGHMLEAIKRIGRYTEDLTESAFFKDEMVQDAVIRNFEIIGEAARNIESDSPDFAARHADIPWTLIYTMRNRVAHDYFSVDLEIAWKTIHQDLPELAK